MEKPTLATCPRCGEALIAAQAAHRYFEIRYIRGRLNASRRAELEDPREVRWTISCAAVCEAPVVRETLETAVIDYIANVEAPQVPTRRGKRRARLVVS